ncbi:hypothetical protein K469DRAFT_283246 [Zopfia rhizophila CBS 207.26]|uniref:Uncharacterized protein n=1 Tax=Zopfia rhizophila CBS 207.26 TaxID=1314779 RepID=A0A6A6EQ11_9PEZI|nr:hypothetical protein K469DRAFT_283246 [Zopfia rhizophila CBS 207.26]
MSTSGPRYHIPFPTNFLSLNTPSPKKPTTAALQGETTSHSFLSNRQTAPRSASISSVSSSGSNSSVPSSPPTKSADASPVQSFLTLNTKFRAPSTSAAGMTTSPDTSAGKHRFLSNRH